MSLFTAATLAAGRLLPGAEEIPFDDKGYTTIDPILPPWKELIPGSLASIIVFSLLYWKAGPIIKKSFRDRTAGIQKQLDDSAAAKAAAETEATRIRRPRATSMPSGLASTPRPTLRPRRSSPTVGSASPPRSPSSRLAPKPTSPRPPDEAATNCASRSPSTPAPPSTRIVRDTLDDAAQQELIESFIARVGASQGVTS